MEKDLIIDVSLSLDSPSVDLTVENRAGGLSVVEHDDTLIGNGDNEPLGVNTEVVATKSHVQEELAKFSTFSISVVDVLPQTGEEKVIYLVPKDGEQPDVHDEYIWVDNSFELIGTTQVDLTGYVKNTDYASYDNAGVMKVRSTYGLYVNEGILHGMPFTLSEYNTKNSYSLVAKGTLENIKKDIVERAVSEDGATLSGYVKNTDYASGDTAGVAKFVNTYRMTCSTNGYVSALTASLAQYNNDSNQIFIGKGTLENIKKDIVERAVSEDGAELSGYVKNTDYPTTDGNTAGVVKIKTSNGLYITNGLLHGNPISLNNYGTFSTYALVCKGTLENIKYNFVKEAVTTNDIELTDEEKAAAQSWLGIDMSNVLVNTATGKNGVAIFTSKTNNSQEGVAVGYNSQASGYRSTAIGYNTLSSGSGGVSVGFSARATQINAVGILGRSINAGAITLGYGQNDEENTFKVALNSKTSIATDESTGLYTLLNSDGKIPGGRMALQGTTAPTTETAGTIGQFYVDTTNGNGYMCVGVSESTYTWKQITI